MICGFETPAGPTQWEASYGPERMGEQVGCFRGGASLGATRRPQLSARPVGDLCLPVKRLLPLACHRCMKRIQHDLERHSHRHCLCRFGVCERASGTDLYRHRRCEEREHVEDRPQTKRVHGTARQLISRHDTSIVSYATERSNNSKSWTARSIVRSLRERRFRLAERDDYTLTMYFHPQLTIRPTKPRRSCSSRTVFHNRDRRRNTGLRSRCELGSSRRDTRADTR